MSYAANVKGTIPLSFKRNDYKQSIDTTIALVHFSSTFFSTQVLLGHSFFIATLGDKVAEQDK